MADEEERKKKKNKLISYRSDFVTPTKVSKTLGVVLHLNSKGLLAPRLKTWLQEHFCGGCPIRYVQDTILKIGQSSQCYRVD